MHGNIDEHCNIPCGSWFRQLYKCRESRAKYKEQYKVTIIIIRVLAQFDMRGLFVCLFACCYFFFSFLNV